MEKRYEHYTKNGIEWTDWFEWDGEKYKWQLKNKLRNEYRD